MNAAPAFNPVHGIFLFLAFLFVVGRMMRSSWLKGVFGEFKINLIANLFLDKKKYRLIKNVTLPTRDGTTQIDHIIVSRHGVFVIETKNMKGLIFGSSTAREWTQVIHRYSGNFQNPLHQNYKHVKTLESLLEISGYKLISVVVFVGDNAFGVEMPSNVIYSKDFIRFVKSKSTAVLSEIEVKEITRKIKSNRLKPSVKTNRAHVRHVRTIVEKKKSSRPCPKCGGAMYLREAQRGRNIGNKFWGCSNFPTCNGVISIA